MRPAADKRARDGRSRQAGECLDTGSFRLAGGVRSLDRTLLRAEFPDKQGICREFSQIPVGFECFRQPKCPEFARLPRQIPYAAEQRIFCAEQRIDSVDQGMFSRFAWRREQNVGSHTRTYRWRLYYVAGQTLRLVARAPSFPLRCQRWKWGICLHRSDQGRNDDDRGAPHVASARVRLL
jgi:hypothetical protein